MIYLTATLNQHFALAELAVAVRHLIGKPLRRATPLTQLALLGALNALPEAQHDLSCALLWQSNRGPRPETVRLLEEVCCGAAEPMPYDFLATQPAITAAQIQPFLPGLQSAMHLPQDSAGCAQWSLLLNLAIAWLEQGRYARVLCAHLDTANDQATGHWLALSATPPAENPVSLRPGSQLPVPAAADTPDFPAAVAEWLQQPAATPLHLQSPAAPWLALEFARR